MSNITERIIRINYARLKDPKFSIEEYLHPNIDKIRKKYKPLHNLTHAAKLFLGSILGYRKIVIVVDIDNDGISSGVIANLTLTKIFNLSWNKFRLVISSRRHRRGFNTDILNKLNLFGMSDVGLLVTADMGSPDESYYKKLKEEYPNLSIILTDHHQIPTDNFPTSVDYVINPQLPENTDYKEICGCGTLYELLREVCRLGKKNIAEFDKLVSGYVAIATIIDMMSMGDLYNKCMVKKGIDNLNLYPDRNILCYKNIFNIKGDISYVTISSNIGPLVNTANRTGKEELMLYGLVTPDDNKNKTIFNYMSELNNLRKQQTRAISTTIDDKIDTRYEDSYVLTIETEYFIGGLIAGQVADRYKRPVIVFTNVEGKYIIDGSARSGLRELDVLSIFKSMPDDIVVSANGHKQACGVSVYGNKLEEFKELLNTKVQEALKSIEIIPETTDLVIPAKDITIDTARQIMEAGPYGIEWKEPLIEIEETLLISKVIPIQDFFKLECVLPNDAEVTISGMVFFSMLSNRDITLANFKEKLNVGDSVKLYCYIKVSSYRGQEVLQMDIKRIEHV